MADEKELTGIERELVLQYLRDDNVPVTVTLEDKPQQVEAEVAAGKANLPEDAERVPASAVFPVAIRSQQMTVLNQGIILLKNEMRTVKQFLGKRVRVQFYFNHLGLYFITTMKECSQGLALVVPSSIKRIEDTPTLKEYEVSGVISFISEDKSIVKIECIPSEKYELFVQPKWGDIELEKQKQAKAYLERFVAESRSEQGVSIGNGVHLFPVCRFLTDTPPVTNAVAVEGRAEPLTILYVNDKRIVFGSRERQEILTLEADYSLNLTFCLEKNKLFKRSVSIKMTVEQEYTAEGENNARCFVCRYTNIKEEDVRFLYERANGRMLED
jgi:hypothetical protein